MYLCVPMLLGNIVSFSTFNSSLKYDPIFNPNIYIIHILVFPISIAFEQSLERIESENFVDPYNIYPESRVGSPVKTTRNYIEETAANDGHGQLKVDLDDALEAYKAANPTHKSCIPFVVQESLRALNLLRFYVCREDKDVLVYLLRQGSTIVEAAARVDVHISR